MTTQSTPPEAPETSVIERVSRLEGIAEQVNLRLAESTEAINMLSVKVDQQGAAIRAEVDTLRAEINRLRSDMHRQTFLLIGIIGGIAALTSILG